MKPSGIALGLVLSVSAVVHAQPVVAVARGATSLAIVAADDAMVCSVNGSEALRLGFGQSEVVADITSLLRPGRNVLSCVLTDRDGGVRYSFGYELRTRDGVVLRSSGTCPGTADCRLPSGTFSLGDLSVLYQP